MHVYSITKNRYKYIWVFIILTHPSVLQELDFIIYTRGGGSWYFRPSSRGGLTNFTPIAGMDHLISEPKFIIPPPPLLISDKSLITRNDILWYLSAMNRHDPEALGAADHLRWFEISCQMKIHTNFWCNVKSNPLIWTLIWTLRRPEKNSILTACLYWAGGV